MPPRSTHPASGLIKDRLTLTSTDRVLILTAADPDFILSVAKRAGEVFVYDISFSALRKVRALAGKVPNLTVADDVYSPETATFDAAVIFAPKGRDFARAQLWNALNALRPGGRVFLVGANDSGIKTVISDMEQLFGNAASLGYKSHHRAASAIRPDAVPVYPWGDIPTEMQTLQLETPAGSVTVATIPGVFSWQDLDAGTAFLLSSANIRFKPTHVVLDLGCGNGVLGVIAARTAGTVVMVDDNLLAVRCARQTAVLNNADNITVLASDVYSELGQRQFDAILCNPPFHKEFDVNTNVAQRMINDAPAHLRRSGRFVLVANAFLKYQQTMKKTFPTVEVSGHNGKFIVIEARTTRPDDKRALLEEAEEETPVTTRDREELSLKGIDLSMFDLDEIELLMSVDDDDDDDWDDEDFDDDDDDFDDGDDDED